MEELKKYHNQVKEIIKELHPNYKDNIADSAAKKLIDIWPEELEQNFFEWINKKPLSEIKVYDLSINDFFKAWDLLPYSDDYIWNQSVYKISYMAIKLALKHINNYKIVPEDEREYYKNAALTIHKRIVL